MTKLDRLINYWETMLKVWSFTMEIVLKDRIEETIQYLGELKELKGEE